MASFSCLIIFYSVFGKYGVYFYIAVFLSNYLELSKLFLIFAPSLVSP